MTRLLAALGLGWALQNLVPLGQRSLFCGPFFVSLYSPAGTAAWIDVGGEDVEELDRIVFCVLYVAPGMIRSGLGDAVWLVDSVVPGMIRRGQSKAVAYTSLSSKECPSLLGLEVDTLSLLG